MQIHKNVPVSDVGGFLFYGMKLDGGDHASFSVTVHYLYPGSFAWSDSLAELLAVMAWALHSPKPVCCFAPMYCTSILTGMDCLVHAQ